MNLNPKFFKNYVPKPLLTTKILHLMDRNPDFLEEWGCKNKKLVSRFMCYKLHKFS